MPSYRQNILDLITEIKAVTNQNPSLLDKDLVFNFKVSNQRIDHQYTINELLERLNFMMDPVLYNELTLRGNVDYITQAATAFKKVSNTEDSIQSVTATPTSTILHSSSYMPIRENIIEDKLIEIERAIRYEEVIKEKIEAIKEQISRKCAYNDNSIILMEQKLSEKYEQDCYETLVKTTHVTSHHSCLQDNERNAILKYYIDNVQPTQELTQQVRLIIQTIQDALPELSVHQISQSFRYIFSAENYDILEIALKDSKELGLKLKDENGTDLLMEFQKMEQQLKSATTNTEKLEKSLEGYISSNVTDYSQVNIFDEIMKEGITTSENHPHDHAVVHIMGICDAEDGTLL